MGSNEQLRLGSKLHPAAFRGSLFGFQNKGQLTDARLVSQDGREFSAHRLVLAANSQMFYDLFVNNSSLEGTACPGGQYCVYLGGMRGEILSYIIQYIYLGETSLPSELLEEFMVASIGLKLNGFPEDGTAPLIDPNEPPTTIAPPDLNSGSGLCAQCHGRPSVSIKPDPDAESHEDDNGYFYDDEEDLKPAKPKKVDSVQKWVQEKSDPSTGEKILQCKNCGYSTSNKSHMKRHLIIKHSKDQELKCEYCEGTFKNKYALQGHLKRCFKDVKIEDPANFSL